MATRGPSTLLYVLLALLMIDALIEMSFIASIVAFLHNRAGRAFQIAYNSGSFSLHGKPEHLLADQGHTSNGAAGTAIIPVGIGGFLTFPLLRRNTRTGRLTTYSHVTLTAWLVFSFLSMLLTLAALIYTMVVTAQHDGQEIDVSLASGLNNQPYPNQVGYPLEKWTPENWFSAVLQLDLVYSGDRFLITQKYRVMKGWHWNLIPMFILGAVVFGVGLLEARKWRSGAEAGATMVMSRNIDMEVQAKKEQDFESAEEGENRVDAPMLSPVSPVSSVARKPVPEQRFGALA